MPVAPVIFAMASGFAALKLVIGVNFVRLLWAVEITQRLVDAGLLESVAEGFQIDAVGRKSDRIGLNPDGRFLSAAN